MLHTTYVSFDVMESERKHMNTVDEIITEESPSIASTTQSYLGENCPKSVVVFCCQIIVLYTVICVSIYNLSTNSEFSTLWTNLLSSCLGYILPQPALKKIKKNLL